MQNMNMEKGKFMKIIKEENITYSSRESASMLGEIVGLTAPINKREYSVAITKLEAGGTVTRHRHAVSDEIYIFTEGCCEMQVNGKSVRASKGTVTVIEPGDWHEILPCCENVTFYAVSFPAFRPEDFLTD